MRWIYINIILKIKDYLFSIFLICCRGKNLLEKLVMFYVESKCCLCYVFVLVCLKWNYLYFCVVLFLIGYVV